MQFSRRFNPQVSEKKKTTAQLENSGETVENQDHTAAKAVILESGRYGS